jgi:menaquinone-dependent protoporphyrinogen oxidase
MSATVLVAYASRHGATQGIAERIAEDLRAAGLAAEVRPVRSAGDLGAFDAFVVGSAVYVFHWMKEAKRFLKDHSDQLAGKPVWLFSSGPLGADEPDAKGRDPRAEAGPKELAELQELVGARDHHVFFGAFHRDKPIGMTERFVMRMPAARDALPEGDFRDWEEIDAWADGIARALREDRDVTAASGV